MINVVKVDEAFSHEICVAIVDTGISGNFRKNDQDLVYEVGEGDTDSTHGELVSNLLTNNPILIENLDDVDKIRFVYVNLKDVNIRNMVEGVEIAVNEGADIILLNLGTYTDDENLKNIVVDAIKQGIIIICAAGNDMTKQYLYPASYEGVIAVSSVDENRNYLLANNHNDQISVCAPGEKIPIEINLNGEVIEVETYGSSAAATIVAAMVTVLKSIKPELDAADVSKIFETTAIDLGEVGRDEYYGYGFVDFKAAVLYTLDPILYYLTER